MGAWEEYNQRPWRSVATTIQSCSINSSQFINIIEEESHTMHQKVQSFKHGALSEMTWVYVDKQNQHDH